MKSTQTLLIFFLLVFVSGCKKENTPPTTAAVAPAIAISPQPEAAFAVSTCFLKQGESVQFNNSSLHAESYLWDFGDGETSELVSPQHSYKTKGIYRVKLLTRNGEKTHEADTTIYYGMKAYVEVNFSILEWLPKTGNYSNLYGFSVNLTTMSENSQGLSYIYSETAQHSGPKLNATRKVVLTGEKSVYNVKVTVYNRHFCSQDTSPLEKFDPFYTPNFSYINTSPIYALNRYSQFIVTCTVSETRFE